MKISQGPVGDSSGFLSPPAPRGSGRPGPLFPMVQIPNALGRLAGPFFFEFPRVIACAGHDKSGMDSPDRLDRGAEHLAGMVERAGLHDDRERVDAVFGESRG